uniref:Fibronectin type-III domain-containing protein n=1 Tax=Oryctolagus cuniculus TaxID=9986 RepID=A0A5F9CFK8_RABIT
MQLFPPTEPGYQAKSLRGQAVRAEPSPRAPVRAASVSPRPGKLWGPRGARRRLGPRGDRARGRGGAGGAWLGGACKSAGRRGGAQEARAGWVPRPGKPRAAPPGAPLLLVRAPGGRMDQEPSVKPKTPGNLTVHTNISDMVLLTWSNPYPPNNFLYDDLSYMLNISSEADPTEIKIYNVTYQGPTLRLPASSLKAGVSYSVRVRARAGSYNSAWSDWSASARWQNHYQVPLEKRLPLGVSISCVVILAICLSCYFSAIKIKKEWWDQIPNPAHSPLVAIVIQDSQVSPWEKRAQGQEPARCPHWKTCLTKLLPCLLEHGVKREEELPKAVSNRPCQGPEKPAWCPGLSKAVLWPERIIVVQCVQLLEAPAQGEEEAVEEDRAGSPCPSPASSAGGFLDGREGIAARLTESLFLDLLGDEPGWGQSALLPSPGSGSAPKPRAEPPDSGWPEEASRQGEEPAFPASLASAGTPVVTDNPAYRSFSACQSQTPPSPPEFAPEPLLVEDSGSPGAASELATGLQPEPGSWEHVLRQWVLQHGAAPAPVSTPSSGYRECVPTEKQASAQDGTGPEAGPPGEAGYKAFASLLAGGSVYTGTPAPGASSGGGGYKPFEHLVCPGDPAPVPMPLFTFGLDVEPPPSPGQPAAKGGDGQKSPPSPAQATEPVRDDLCSGIVYSALTCHLCGHLKQCHGQEESGQAQVVASPCCGCCCGDGAEPRSPWRTPDPSSPPNQAHLPPASPEPLGGFEEGKPQAAIPSSPSHTWDSSQPPKMAGLVSAGSTHTRVA